MVVQGGEGASLAGGAGTQQAPLVQAAGVKGTAGTAAAGVSGVEGDGGPLTLQGQGGREGVEGSWSLIRGDQAGVGCTAVQGASTLCRGDNESCQGRCLRFSQQPHTDEGC